jgi:hypothetical protein
MATAAGTPVVSIHGLWLHADSWGSWMDLFKEQGWREVAETVLAWLKERGL